MKQNYILTELDPLIKFLQQLKETHPDRVFVTGVTVGGSASAPTKRRKSYSHKLEHVFAPECFVGNGVQAIIDGGGFYIAHIPREHINPEFLKDERHK